VLCFRLVQRLHASSRLAIQPFECRSTLMPDINALRIFSFLKLMRNFDQSTTRVIILSGQAIIEIIGFVRI
jgi:hypothetical protein